MAPSAGHEERRTLLEDIATLAGFDLTPSIALPDGARPDVFMVDSRCGAVFMGEAKDTETPGCEMTFRRLSCYMRWFKVFIDNGLLGSVFVLCFGQSAHISGWKDVILRLAKETKIDGLVIQGEQLDQDVYMVWLRALPERTNKNWLRSGRPFIPGLKRPSDRFDKLG